MRFLNYRGVLLIVALLFSIQPVVQAQGAAPFPTRNWTIAAATDQGLDVTRLEAAHQHIRANLPAIHSLLVVRHGYLVWESYYGTYRRNVRHSVVSVTKSVTSALVGIASDRGLINIDQPIWTYLPEYFPEGSDGAKMGITARNLLMMRSGINWMEYLPYSFEAKTVVSNVGYPLALGMAASPGDSWRYSTGDYHVLAGLVARVTGQPTRDFASQNLFGPMGITNWRWDKDQTGQVIGGVGLAMLPRDMAKFGLLYLNNGYWDGRQLVSPGWVQLTMSAQPGNPPLPEQPGYGYGWWVIEMHGQRMYYASGFGGQFIFVIPSQDMVVVITANENADPGSAKYNTDQGVQIVNSYVLPAVQR
jgi:CubicO group peptidase (beta-lactamase class C family)